MQHLWIMPVNFTIAVKQSKEASQLQLIFHIRCTSTFWVKHVILFSCVSKLPTCFEIVAKSMKTAGNIVMQLSTTVTYLCQRRVVCTCTRYIFKYSSNNIASCVDWCSRDCSITVIKLGSDNRCRTILQLLLKTTQVYCYLSLQVNCCQTGQRKRRRIHTHTIRTRCH